MVGERSIRQRWETADDVVHGWVSYHISGGDNVVDGDDGDSDDGDDIVGGDGGHGLVMVAVVMVVTLMV